jgi:hypothetical protein
MTQSQDPSLAWTRRRRELNWLERMLDWKPLLVVACMLPAVGLLMVFLTYPLGLGIWLAFTDTQIGGNGKWVGLENFIDLMEDPIFLQSVWWTFVYTAIATVGGTVLNYVDAAVTNGTSYSYKVTATNANGSADSAVVSATPQGVPTNSACTLACCASTTARVCMVALSDAGANSWAR